MISFILPFMTKEKDKFLNLNDGFEYSDSSNIVYSTMKTIKNINSLSCEKEIILIDNSHTWSDIELPNVKVIKGWQSFTEEELMNIPEFMNHRNHKLSLENIGCDTMWASMAFHLGIKESKGDYIVLQHNDTFYHQDCLDDMIKQIEEENLFQETSHIKDLIANSAYEPNYNLHFSSHHVLKPQIEVFFVTA